MAGFTLLELLVVVGILAVIAGVSIASFGETDEQAQIKAAKYEMEQIRRAIMRYRQDVGVLNQPASPADMEFLYQQGAVDSWNIDYQTGWRGPYLTSGDGGLVDMGDGLNSNGTGSPVAGSANTLIRATPDPFVLPSVANGVAWQVEPCQEDSANDRCLFDWRFVGQVDNDEPHERFGRPYLLFDLNNGNARIVSMGPNGKYDLSGGETCPVDSSATDDIVLCLH